MADETQEPAFVPTPVPPGAVPAFYGNGFTISLTNTDVGIVLLLNNQPQIGIQLSFTTAKTLSMGLGQAISQLEQVVDREIMTSTFIAEAISKSAPESKAAT